MTLQIDDLIEDCLLHIFRFIDPLNLVSTAQVCKRWERLTKPTLTKITSLQLNDPLLCYKIEYEIIEEMNVETIKSALEYFGHQVKSVKLGICFKNTVFLNHKYGYHITDDLDSEDFVSTLFEACKNIVDVQIGEWYMESESLPEQLLKLNGKLKKLLLHSCESVMFPNCIFETVEEVIWEVRKECKVENIDTLFPNLKKLELHIVAQIDEIETVLNSILQRVKVLKSLTIKFYTSRMPKFYMKMLSDISALSELEELEILNDQGWGPILVELTADSVANLIQNCQNLRTVKLENVSLGLTDVSSFLNLSKLEKLLVSNARFFSADCVKKIKSDKFENLTALKISFDKENRLDLSGMCDAIQKMPALKYLLIDEMPKELTTEITCRVTEKQILNRDIVVIPGSHHVYNSIRVFHGRDTRLRDESLKLWIHSQRNDYCDQVFEFFRSLKNCTVVVDDRSWYRDVYPGMLCIEYDELFHFCSCHYDDDDDY